MAVWTPGQSSIKKEILVCFTLKPSSSKGLEKATSLAFMCDRCPGWWGVGATGCRYTEIHSLFTGSPDRAFGVWTRSASLGPCPGGVGSGSDGGHPAPLGHAAAGAGAALSAADAVGCAAVLRGRW